LPAENTEYPKQQIIYVAESGMSEFSGYLKQRANARRRENLVKVSFS
jgi:hypothetical protein